MFQGLPCVERALGRFLAGHAAGGCSATAARAVRPVVDPRRKVPAFAAVQLTLDDVLEQLRLTLYTKSSFQDEDFVFFVRAGGLRGGRYSATLHSLTLERVTVVPGVTVSGRITGIVNPISGAVLRGTGRLTVRLPAGRGGTLDLQGGRATGTLAGRRVAGRLTLDGR